MTDNDDSLYDDLVTFLKSERADLRKAACEATLSTVTNHGTDAVRRLVARGAVPPLCRCVDEPGPTGRDALAALLAATSATDDDESASRRADHAALETALLEARAIARATDAALSLTRANEDDDEERRRAHRAVALLANLTRSERGAAALLRGDARETSDDHDDDDDATSSTELEFPPSLRLLLARFLSDRYARTARDEEEEEVEDAWDEEEELRRAQTSDPYLHFASVLVNLTQINAGRHFVTSMHAHRRREEEATDAPVILPPLLQTLLFHVRTSPSRLRRRYLAAVVKNCCFDTDVSKLWLAPLANADSPFSTNGRSIDEEWPDVVDSLLAPLVGPEGLDDEDERALVSPVLLSRGPDARREPDVSARRAVVETLLLLCASGRRSRGVLRARGAYAVLRDADLVEDDEIVSERIDECVQFLRRDEEGAPEGSSDDAVRRAARDRRRANEQQAALYDDVD